MNTKEVYIFEASQKNFETVVIQNSHKLPVLVEFMGIWSGPCIQMSEEISTLAKEFVGEFIFAKVDIDEQPELMKEYAIENIPSLKVLVNGKVVQTEEGLLTQKELRDVLKNVGVYSQVNELRQAAQEKHMTGDTATAIQLLSQAMQQDPSNTNTAMDMVQIFIDLNEKDQAIALFNQLPNNAKTSDMGKLLTGQLTFLDLASKTNGKSQLQQLLMTTPNDCDANFDLAICLIAEKDYEQAVNHLLDIMKINPDYKDHAAREMAITVINMLAPNNAELSSQLRRKLSAINFS